jgi:uncharacterized protein YigE (DUF2233 family)
MNLWPMKTTLKATAIVCILARAVLGSSFGVEFATNQLNGKRFTVCRVDTRADRLELFLRDDMGQPFRSFDKLEKSLRTGGRQLKFAMNAGMFDRDYTPVGLFVQSRREISPLNLSDGQGNFFLKPNGVFLFSPAGVQVVESSEYPKHSKDAIFATQSGPLLVRHGKLHPVFNSRSTSRLIRNGVGVSSPTMAIFVISDDPVNFHEFAAFFRDTLNCPDALYLDGVISSLHAPPLGRSDTKSQLGPIIAVTATTSN